MLYREFWEAGHRVFGLHPIVDGRCGCGHKDCKMAGKHPAVSNWQYTPVWSDEQIETMELIDAFQTGYGVLVHGMLVIDVDARNGGVASFDRLRNDFPEIERAGLIVNTGSGNGSQHLYFSVPPGLALVQKHNDYNGIDFKSSGFVCGPGSLHATGKRYEVAHGSVEDIDAAPQALLDALKKPERHRAEFNGSHMDVTHNDLAQMLSHIDADIDHETWVRCGMAVHHATGGTGFDVWDGWSAGGSKYPGRSALERRWHSFGKSSNPVTLATLVHYAQQGGWSAPVEFESNIEFDYVETPSAAPLIDLRRPPGFVGQVTAWINDQCRRPRENLAAGAALTAIGNLCGLRYTDDLDGVTTNLFAFCVAGSGTGKEAVLQSVAEIHRAAGVHVATHGSIKSEQEIIRNLTRHQASFYAVDEVGILLKKIRNAQKSGGAIYLDGVIGTLMSAYSKANSFMLLTGDAKEEVRNSIVREIARLERRIEEGDQNPKTAADLEGARRGLMSIDDGLEKPFLSLIGFTTPVTFDETVDYANATNGFIGRSIIFNERNDTPELKEDFSSRAMPFALKMGLAQLYGNGEANAISGARVEYYGDRIKIPTMPDAKAEMKLIAKRFDALAHHHKETTGLHALALRAYEMVAKVSLILAVPEGLRTVEHVQWAEALVKRDIEEKARLVIGNDRQKDDPALALRSRIENLISGEDGETLGVMTNRLRPAKKADIENCLARMVKSGSVEVIEVPNKYAKTPTRRYLLK